MRLNEEGDAGVKYDVLVCGGTGCTSSGSETLLKEFDAQLEKYGVKDQVQMVKTGCFGLCALGPIVIVYPEGTFYSRVQVEDVEKIVASHLVKGEV
ncbi:MAG: (2Fe-2S) ferredoxin domain-containing protein, partial [Clostridia bacterium]|nr:(2Fe-2S) ferredoxin domain-containing protein [Clostridia bacterium]